MYDEAKQCENINYFHGVGRKSHFVDERRPRQ